MRLENVFDLFLTSSIEFLDESSLPKNTKVPVILLCIICGRLMYCYKDEEKCPNWDY